MARAPDCQFCGAFAFGWFNGGYHTSCGTYHRVSEGSTWRSPDCELNQLRQVVREAVVRLSVAAVAEENIMVLKNEIDSVIDDLQKAVGDE